MKRAELVFARPKELEATLPTEVRGIERDAVRLMVTTPTGHTHASFRDLPDFLIPGDLLVVNRSATLAASLPAEGRMGQFIVNLSTYYGGSVWLAEPRCGVGKPGPMAFDLGEEIMLGETTARVSMPYPGIPELWFIAAHADLRSSMARCGQPIRYGYIRDPYPLDLYQTLFADTPGSAEMPSAGRPFTRRLVERLDAAGVAVADVTLHTGVSSLEVETDDVEEHTLYPEPFDVPSATAQAVNSAHQQGRRVIAVGTTVVRALETAWDGAKLRPASGFTRRYVHPGSGVNAVDGLITGLHDPVTSHLAMLYALSSRDVIRDAYSEAIQQGYLWHEFGDSHLIFRN